jgi:hypothetical protein
MTRDGKMNVIFHQAICPQLDPRFESMRRKELKIGFPVLIAEKNGLLPVPPLDNVVGITRDDDTRQTRHFCSREQSAVRTVCSPYKGRTKDTGLFFSIAATGQSRS